MPPRSWKYMKSKEFLRESEKERKTKMKEKKEQFYIKRVLQKQMPGIILKEFKNCMADT